MDGPTRCTRRKGLKIAAADRAATVTTDNTREQETAPKLEGTRNETRQEAARYVDRGDEHRASPEQLRLGVRHEPGTHEVHAPERRQPGDGVGHRHEGGVQGVRHALDDLGWVTGRNTVSLAYYQ